MGRSMICRPSSRSRQLHDAIARDAFQHVLVDRRRDQLAVAHHEDVAGGAFGDMAVLIQEDGFVESVVARFVAGQGAVDVGAADLGARRNGVVFDAPPGTYAGVDSVLCMQIFAEGQRDDGKGVLIVGAHADALGAFVGQRADIDVGAECIAAHQLDGDGAQLLGRRGERRCAGCRSSASSARSAPSGAGQRAPALARPNARECPRRLRCHNAVRGSECPRALRARACTARQNRQSDSDPHPTFMASPPWQPPLPVQLPSARQRAFVESDPARILHQPASARRRRWLAAGRP